MTTAGEVLDAVHRLDDRMEHRFDGIDTRLDTMNGTQKRHTAEIAVIQNEQGTHCREIRELKGKVADLVVTGARKAGMYVAWGAFIGLIVAIVEYVVAPIITKTFGG